MHSGNASRSEVMPGGQFIQCVVDEWDFRSLAMERYFQVAGARRAISLPAARRIEAHRARPD
jgi:hypothetical protein